MRRQTMRRMLFAWNRAAERMRKSRMKKKRREAEKEREEDREIEK